MSTNECEAMLAAYDHLEYIGMVKRKFEPKNYGRTNGVFQQALIKHYQHIPEWTDDYLPAQKTLQGAINSFKRFDNPSINLPEPQLSLSYDWMVRDMEGVLKDSRIAGFSETISYMDGSKSPGYPWCIEVPTKADYWEEEVGSFYQTYWDALGTDDPIWSLSALNHKTGELISKAKIEADKPRTVIAMDVNHTTALLQLFGDQADRIVAEPIKHGSLVGVSPFNLGWHTLAGHVQRVGRAMSIDGKLFDAKFWFVYFMLIAKMRYGMLHPRHKSLTNWNRARNLYLMLGHCYVVQVTGSVWLMRTGGPSGHGLTTHDNGCKAQLDWGMIWQFCTPREYHTYEQYKKHCLFLYYSDDDMPAFSDEVVAYFTADTIGAAGKRIGMDYTFVTNVPVHLSELTILSMGFVTRTWRGHSAVMPLHDCKKMICSLLHGGKDLKPATLISRFAGIAAIGWTCVACKPLYDAYRSMLLEQFPPNTTPGVGAAWKSVLSDTQLGQLFFGTEGPIVRHGIGSASKSLLTGGLVFSTLDMPPKKTTTSSKKKKVTIKQARPSTAMVISPNYKGNKPDPTRMVPRITGQGAYHVERPLVKAWGSDKSVGRYLGEAAGHAAFGPIGGFVGGAVGHALHKGVRWLTGMGAYTKAGGSYKAYANKFVAAHHKSLTNHGTTLLVDGHLPEFRDNQGGNGQWNTIVNEECVGSVYASTGFTVQSFRVNPGVSATFPWLSGPARNYRDYRIRGMVFYIKSYLNNSSSATVLGQWGMTTRYNSADAAPISFAELDDQQYSQSDVGTNPIVAIVECDPKQNPGDLWRAVLPDSSVSGAADLCVIDVATQGYTNNTDRVGSLYVSYMVDFNKTQLNRSLTARTAFWDSGIQPTGSLNVMPAGLAPVNGSSLAGVWQAGGYLSMPKVPGNYMLHWCVTSNVTATGSTAAFLVQGSQCSGDANYINASTYYQANSVQAPTSFNYVVSGGTTMGFGCFSYTAATPGNAKDVYVTFPQFSTSGTFRAQVWLYPRESAINPVLSLAEQSELEAVLVRRGILPAEQVDESTSAFVQRITYGNSGSPPTTEQWPYYGPCPPTDPSPEADEEHIVAEAAHNLGDAPPPSEPFSRSDFVAVESPNPLAQHPEVMSAAAAEFAEQTAAMSLLQKVGLTGAHLNKQALAYARQAVRSP